MIVFKAGTQFTLQKKPFLVGHPANFVLRYSAESNLRNFILKGDCPGKSDTDHDHSKFCFYRVRAKLGCGVGK
jgi:hypothetical protein